MENRLIKAVFIDIDNTLLDFNKSASEAVKKSFEHKGLTYTPEVFDAFTRINDAMWIDIENGVITKEEHSKMRWRRIFEYLGIDEDGESFEDIFIGYLDKAAVPVEKAKEMLDYLSSKYHLYAASNGAQRQQEDRLKIAGFLRYFDDVFTSQRMGYHKPDRGFFENCFTHIPYKRDEVILIGDSISADVRGAIEYGIKSCWFNFFKMPAPTDLNPDFVIDSLTEIKNIM